MAEQSFQEPKFVASMTFSLPDKSQIVRDIYRGDPPMEVQDEYSRLAGDGKARVSASTDMSIKDFGTGASAMCSVSITVNQDQGSIERGLQVCWWLAKKYATQFRQEAEQEMLNILASRGATPSPALMPPGQRYG